MARKPLFSKSILGNAEIFAVFGIFTLYALEFAGIHSFSQLIPDTPQAELTSLSFVSITGEPTSISIGTFGIMALTGLGIIVYFVLIRPRLRR